MQRRQHKPQESTGVGVLSGVENNTAWSTYSSRDTISTPIYCQRLILPSYLPRDSRREVLDDDAVLGAPGRAVLVDPAAPAAASASPAVIAVAPRPASVLHRDPEARLK